MWGTAELKYCEAIAAIALQPKSALHRVPEKH